MIKFIQQWLGIISLCIAGGLLTAPAWAADTLNWQTNRNRVSADIKTGNLFPLLEQIASVTGWHVYVEPDTSRAISAKFDDLPPGEALRLLLGDLNFALIPETNTSPKLFVFRTTLRNATQLVQPAKPAASPAKAKVIPNELIVRLKPGAKIDELAKLLGAKVIGRIDSLNAYRLQFDDQAATDTARQQLVSNPDVASVDSNYVIDRPQETQGLAASARPLQLQLTPPPADGRILIGLIDTAVQPLNGGLNAFLLKQLSVAGEAQLDPNSLSHGTAMAETMLRTLQDLNNGSTSVQILPVDVYGPNPASSTFDVAQGIALAVNKGANPINLSLGGPADSQVLRDVILDGSQKGIIFYTAKGNTPDTNPVFPAADPGANAVTALTSTGQIASYANQAPIPAIGAAGTVVLPYNNQTFITQGTSVSTAIVTATAGSLMENGSMTATEANKQLQNKPTPTTLPGR